MSYLTPSYELGSGQVILEGLPAGAAGEASLVPAAGVDLAFDRADGHLTRVVVEAGGADGLGEPTVALLTRLFGPHAPGVARRAAAQEAKLLSPEPELSGTLSRLARLDAARATSPVPPSSPWWAAEAAELAKRAGLPVRARAEARRAVRELAEVLMQGKTTLPEEALRLAQVVADIAAADEPAAATEVRERLRGNTRPNPFGKNLSEPGLDVAAEVEGLEKERVRPAGLQWMLDLDLMPERLFRPGLSPHSDLSIRHEDAEGRIVVEAVLDLGAERDAVNLCQARLVDPGVRRILAEASFAPVDFRARAELVPHFPLDELHEPWIDVVHDRLRPVRSVKGHRIRRALRWADAALRAERSPEGVAPQSAREDWAALAVIAWERCRRDWEAAGDADRAFLAARRLATSDPARSVLEAPSATADELADRAQVPGPACLAETVGF
jgi:hypothetical protein